MMFSSKMFKLCLNQKKKEGFQKTLKPLFCLCRGEKTPRFAG
jgi:hypothetical protein